jgi:hypothetical protein
MNTSTSKSGGVIGKLVYFAVVIASFFIALNLHLNGNDGFALVVAGIGVGIGVSFIFSKRS